MKKFFDSRIVTFFVLTLLSLASVASAQYPVIGVTQDHRPFDFSDEFYKSNGIDAAMLINRKNGADGQSVFDTSNDGNFTNVRITETRPGYSTDNNRVYWNLYATATPASFTPDEAGARAEEIAHAYPVYVFPSATVKGADRQASMIGMDLGYFKQNSIGIGRVLIVEFTERIFTKSGWLVSQTLIERNGASLDGTPIIANGKELESLEADGFVTVRRSDGVDRPAYVVAKVIEFPELGITSDAFLVYVRQQDGQPLAAERPFITKFECFQNRDSDRECP